MAPKTRGWVFTIHGGHLGTPHATPAILHGKMLQLRGKFDATKHRSMVMQLEKGGNTERVHIQGYIWFKNEVRSETLKAFLECGDYHGTAAKGNLKKNFDYCTKQETKLAGFESIILGNVPSQGDRSDLRSACEQVKERFGLQKLIEEEPMVYVRNHRGLEKVAAHWARKRVPQIREVTTIVLHGDPDGGKSYTASQSDIDQEIYNVPYSEGNTTWFDNYNGERTIVLEDFSGGIAYRYLLRILDGYRLQIAVKGAFHPAAWSRVIITTNVNPQDWYSATNKRGQEQNRWSNDYDQRIGSLERRIDEIWHVEGRWSEGAVWTQVKPIPVPTEEEVFDILSSPDSVPIPPPQEERPAIFRTDVNYMECTYCGIECGTLYCSQDCEAMHLADIAHEIRMSKEPIVIDSE